MAMLAYTNGARPGYLASRLRLSLMALVLAGAFSTALAAAARAQSSGIHKIRHVVVLMMENRSFDNYFGTYPGVDGLPRRHGHFTVCLPNPNNGGCQRPYHDPNFVNGGGPHDGSDFTNDLDGGRMDGFIADAENPASGRGCGRSSAGICNAISPADVMGYHTGRELPVYWSYARHFVLADHMFEPTGSWSPIAHLFEV